MIKGLIAGKSARERANIKATEIAKNFVIGKFKNKEYQVEILSLSRIENGVELLARAWKNGRQLGFGAEGYIDVERFRIINPPVLVRDENGDHQRHHIDSETGLHVGTSKYREDANAAIVESLFDTIRLVGKEGADILHGSIGSTVDTIYASNENHASYYNGGIPATWSTMKDSAGTQNDSSSATYDTMIRQSQNAPPTNWRQSVRGAYTFVTSGVGTDAISAAVFSLWGTAGTWTLTGISAQERPFVITSHAALANNTTDYNIANYGSTEFASFDPGSDGSNWSTTGYNDWTFNSDGRDGINKTGTTYLGCWIAAELYNDEPADNATDYVRWQITAYTMDQAGTTNDPKLVITHAPAGSSSPTPTTPPAVIDQVAPEVPVPDNTGLDQSFAGADSGFGGMFSAWSSSLSSANSALADAQANLAQFKLLDTAEIKSIADNPNFTKALAERRINFIYNPQSELWLQRMAAQQAVDSAQANKANILEELNWNMKLFDAMKPDLLYSKTDNKGTLYNFYQNPLDGSIKQVQVGQKGQFDERGQQVVWQH